MRAGQTVRAGQAARASNTTKGAVPGSVPLGSSIPPRA